MFGIERAFLSMGFVGFSPILPGTCGSLLSVGILFGLNKILPSSALLTALCLGGIFGIVFALAHAAIPRAANSVKLDHDWIVIDEFLGMLLALLPMFFFAEFTGSYLLVGFAVFRFFDMVKPFGIKIIDRRNTPLSVIADDIVAGLYALVCVAGVFLGNEYFWKLW
jgi:phosphatidylglycerophosphatase A